MIFLNRFFFEPVDLRPLGIFRIFFGLYTLILSISWFESRRLWFLDGGLVSQGAAQAMNPHRLAFWVNLWPSSPEAITSLLILGVVLALLLTLGLFSRMSALGFFVIYNLMMTRNPVIENCSDAIGLNLCFFLIFSKSGNVLSLDRLIFKCGEGVSPWAWRLMQIQISIVYIMTVIWKLSFSSWQDGTYLYYLSQLSLYRNHLLLSSLYRNLFTIKMATWGVLAVELALGILIWTRKLRLPVICLGFLFHGALFLSLNVRAFQILMMVTLLLFLKSEDLDLAVKLKKWIWPVDRKSQPAIVV